MRRKLRHILPMIATGWLLISCAEDAPDSGVSGSEMQFEVRTPSRAPVTADTNITQSPFAVYGNMKFTGGSPPGTPIVIFNGTTVSYNGLKWIYDTPQYWFPKHEHSFVAVHPADLNEVSNMNYSGNALSLDYTLPTNYTDARDLMIATHRRMYENEETSSSTAIVLRFNHALSRVNFLVKCDGAGEIVMINQISLAKLGKSGTLTITPAPLTSGSTQTDDYNLFWTGSRNDEMLVADLNVKVVDGDKCDLFPASDPLFVIPQPDNNGIITNISYTLFFPNGKTEDRTLTAETFIGGWEPGKVYTYSLTFTADNKPIEITVTVNDWKDGTTADVTVPRK